MTAQEALTQTQAILATKEAKLAEAAKGDDDDRYEYFTQQVAYFRKRVQEIKAAM